MTTSLSGTAARRYGCTAAALAVAAVALQAAPALAAPAAPAITAPSGDTVPSVQVTWQPVRAPPATRCRSTTTRPSARRSGRATTVNTVSVPDQAALAPGPQYVQRAREVRRRLVEPLGQRSLHGRAGAGPRLHSPRRQRRHARPARRAAAPDAGRPVPGAPRLHRRGRHRRDFVSADDLRPPSPPRSSCPTTRHPASPTTGASVPTSAPAISTAYSASRMLHRAAARDRRRSPVRATTRTSPTSCSTGPRSPGAKYYELQVDDDFDFNSLETGRAVRRSSAPASPRRPPSATTSTSGVCEPVDLDDNPTAWVRLAGGPLRVRPRLARRPAARPPAAAPPRRPSIVSVTTSTTSGRPSRTPRTTRSGSAPTPTSPTRPRRPVQCSVAGTTYTPGELSRSTPACPAAEGGTYYWKVRPIDLPYPGGVAGIFSDHPGASCTRTGRPSRITSPVNGSTVTVPDARLGAGPRRRGRTRSSSLPGQRISG